MTAKLKWTIEACIEESKKYSSLKEFRSLSGSAYDKASKTYKIIDEIVELNNWKKHNLLTKEYIIECALKCENSSEFHKNYKCAYDKASTNGWLPEITQHFVTTRINQLDFPRIIYCYEFEDNSIYIGLTKDFKARHRSRLFKNNCCVMEHIKNTGLQPTIKFLTDFIPALTAQIKEQDYIDDYRNKGYNILNKVRGGGLGGSTQIN